MNKPKSRLWIGMSLILALGAGFGAARLLGDAPASIAAGAEHGEEDGHEAGHPRDAAPAAGKAKDDEGVVALTPEQTSASGIEVVAVGRGGGHETRLSGRVESAVGARASVAAVVGGRVERVLVAPGTAIKAGAPLAVVVSGEAATLRAGADAASAQAEAARLAFSRDRTLTEQGVVARQELEASRARSLAADAAARAAQAQVAAAGRPDAGGRMTITSPVPGVVGTVQVTPGGFVSAGDLIATVADPAQTELVFTAPPTLVPKVGPGTAIEVTGPGGSFRATVVGAAADVREQGGVAIIRARADAGSLPPAGSAVAGVVVAGETAGALTVPADAVQTVDGRPAVFVAVDKGFRATPVLTGRRAGGEIEILDGLTGQERVVGSNAFLLKAELAKGEAEHGH